MILIDNILLDENLVSTPFLCDLGKCKGACCTVKGGQGAPVLDGEVEDIQNAIKPASKYLSERSLSFLNKHGAIEGEAGELSTVCIDDRDCVFVFYEGDVAKCAIEKAYFAGETSFRKPLSCHLFPIRIADFHGPYLYYDEFEGCQPALPHGKKHNVHIPEAVKEALIRAFGEEWYETLDKVVQEQKKSDGKIAAKADKQAVSKATKPKKR
jgi:hypothetical protein